jgi:hypothetical protein
MTGFLPHSVPKGPKSGKLKTRKGRASSKTREGPFGHLLQAPMSRKKTKGVSREIYRTGVRECFKEKQQN